MVITYSMRGAFSKQRRVDVVGNEWRKKNMQISGVDVVWEASFNGMENIVRGTMGFIRLWFPKKYSIGKVMEYVGYLIKHLGRLGVSGYVMIQVLKNPFMYGYYVSISFIYPKGKRGVLKKIIEYVRKLEKYGVGVKVEVQRGIEFRVVYG